MKYYLAPRFDSRKSFYDKAVVEEYCGSKELYSYNHKVCTITTDKDGNKTLVLHYLWNYSPTTLRHVKEFLKQEGFKADSKAQIAEDYDND